MNIALKIALTALFTIFVPAVAFILVFQILQNYLEASEHLSFWLAVVAGFFVAIYLNFFADWLTKGKQKR